MPRVPSVSKLVPAFAAALIAQAPVIATEALMDERGPFREPAVMAERSRAQLRNPVADLRIGASLISAPEVTETVTVPSSGSAGYEWVGPRGAGGGGSIGYVTQAWALDRDWGGLALGLEFQYQYFNTTPDSYRVGGTTVTNSNQSIVLTWQNANLAAIAGWATGPWWTRFGEWHVELLAVGAGGLSWGETQAGGTTGSVRGVGWNYAVGPRLGIYLHEDHWVFGARGDWIFSHGEVDIGLAGGQESTLEANGSGPAGTLEVGYRF